MQSNSAKFKVGVSVLLAAVIVAGGWWLLRSKTLPPRESNQVPLPGRELGSSERAPNFALQDYSGKTVRLSDFDAPIVVNAWAAWCPFCREELRDFAAVHPVKSPNGDHGAGQVVIIAINRGESLETAKAYTDSLGVTDDLVFLLDPTDSFYAAIGGFAMPETIFVKKDGTIHFHKRGVMTQDEIRTRVQELVNAE